MPKCSVANAPIDRPTTCALSILSTSSTARIALEILRHVGRRVAARVVGDAAVAPREVTHLGLPTAVVAAELVNEHDRHASAGLLVVKLDAVVRGELGH